MDFFESLEDKTPCSMCGDTGITLLGKGGVFQPAKCPCVVEGHRKNVVAREIPASWWDLHIPNLAYRVPFNAELLELPRPIEQLSAFEFNKWQLYKVTLNQLLASFAQGYKPVVSYYVSAPNGYGKHFFVFNMMQEAYRYGLEPSPLYSLWEIQQSMQKRSFVQKLFRHDILFIQHNPAFTKELTECLAFLLDECEVRGIPLIMISRQSPQTIHAVDSAFDYKISEEVSSLSSFSEMQHVYLPDTFKKSWG